MIKTIGIIGLGLIGGSMARALKRFTSYTVAAYDLKESVLAKALTDSSIDCTIAVNDGDEGISLSNCDMLIVALYPEDCIRFVTAHAPRLRPGTLIVDCCGVKGSVCSALSGACAELGIFFVGGHPMAGTEKFGYDNSHAELFKGASMILCRDEHTNEVAIKAAERVFVSIGFSGVTVTTPQEHDRIIAFTSQLAHVVSSAYIKSDTAKLHMGFSAGSYKDLTRVARLDEFMWSELFLQNPDALLREIDTIIKNLNEYRDVIAQGDRPTLIKLLRDGRLAKEKLG